MEDDSKIEFFENGEILAAKKSYHQKTIIIAAVFILFSVSFIFLFLYEPTLIISRCNSHAKEQTKNFQAAPAIPGLPSIANSIGTEQLQYMQYNSCLKENGFLLPINAKNTFNKSQNLLYSFALSFVIQTIILFVYLLLFSNLATKRHSLYKAMLLAFLLISVSTIGAVGGFATLIIAAVINFALISVFFKYSFVETFLFTVAYSLVNMAISFAIASIMLNKI